MGLPDHLVVQRSFEKLEAKCWDALIIRFAMLFAACRRYCERLFQRQECPLPY